MRTHLLWLVPLGLLCGIVLGRGLPDTWGMFGHPRDEYLAGFVAGTRYARCVEEWYLQQDGQILSRLRTRPDIQVWSTYLRRRHMPEDVPLSAQSCGALEQAILREGKR